MVRGLGPIRSNFENRTATRTVEAVSAAAAPWFDEFTLRARKTGLILEPARLR
jgi:hypothetical protein